ncbi:MAG: SoxR reducing system RseC family protein [Tissierellia bacterium]|nr:SoxR reducing system RseC family protein [Tissierellia bacterium]
MSLINKKAIVVKKEKDKTQLMVLRDSACGSCSTCGGCEVKPSFIELSIKDMNLKAGDEVIITTKSSDLLKMSWAIYILPVIMMIIGAVISNIMFKDKNVDLNIVTFLSVIVFLALSLFIIKFIDSRFKKDTLIKVKRC